LPQIGLIIADDMPPIREYLSMMLGREKDINIINVVGSRVDAIHHTLTIRPDVLLIDLSMGTPRSVADAIKTITTMAPEIKPIVLTLFNDDDNIFTAFEAGASDYVLKDFPAAEILEALRMAVNDVIPLRLQIARLIQAENKLLGPEQGVFISTLNIIFRLMPKELGILRLLMRGKNEHQIARLQNVECLIIENYVRNILQKFGEVSTSDLVNRFHQLAIFQVFSDSS
jgi:Response regulator containing a CheY-like receiver domain and an HTH DNA-binding domain